MTMLKSKLLISAICAALCTTTIAPSALAQERKGFSLGIDYGRTEAKKYCNNIADCDDTDKGPKVELGYDFNEYWSAELGYTSFGTVFDSNEGSLQVTQKSNAITLSALGTVPLGEWFGVYGRFGYARYDTNNSGMVESVAIDDESGYTPFWGAGVSVNLSEEFSLRLEYQNYADLSDLPGRKDDVQGLYGGVVYHF
jgi:OmpA-OmpF porin, OOP family